jgi:mRNA interferase RelE/StbE
VASYSVLIKTSAGKELAAVASKNDREKLVARIQALATNPRPHGSQKLAGYADRYRLRQGNFRIVYLIDDEASAVTIFKIGDRKEVYR